MQELIENGKGKTGKVMVTKANKFPKASGRVVNNNLIIKDVGNIYQSKVTVTGVPVAA